MIRLTFCLFWMDDEFRFYSRKAHKRMMPKICSLITDSLNVLETICAADNDIYMRKDRRIMLILARQCAFVHSNRTNVNIVNIIYWDVTIPAHNSSLIFDDFILCFALSLSFVLAVDQLHNEANAIYTVNACAIININFIEWDECVCMCVRLCHISRVSLVFLLSQFAIIIHLFFWQTAYVSYTPYLCCIALSQCNVHLRCECFIEFCAIESNRNMTLLDVVQVIRWLHRRYWFDVTFELVTAHTHYFASNLLCTISDDAKWSNEFNTHKNRTSSILFTYYSVLTSIDNDEVTSRESNKHQYVLFILHN